jgi:hypothetical protein
VITGKALPPLLGEEESRQGTGEQRFRNQGSSSKQVGSRDLGLNVICENSGICLESMALTAEPLIRFESPSRPARIQHPLAAGNIQGTFRVRSQQCLRNWNRFT